MLQAPKSKAPQSGSMLFQWASAMLRTPKSDTPKAKLLLLLRIIVVYLVTGWAWEKFVWSIEMVGWNLLEGLFLYFFVDMYNAYTPKRKVETQK